MFKSRHCKLFHQDTMCVDLQAHLALSLHTGEMGHTKKRTKKKKKGKLKNSWGANRKLLESSRAFHGVVTLLRCLFSVSQANEEEGKRFLPHWFLNCGKPAIHTVASKKRNV